LVKIWGGAQHGLKYPVYIRRSTDHQVILLKMLTVVKEGERFILSLSKIDKLNALFSGLVGPQVHKLVNEAGRHIIMDLNGIHFIDSSGLDMLTRATSIARAKNSRFELINLHPDVMKVIDRIGLTPRLVIADRQA
jgi:anti-anti-sigma factor